MSLSRPRALLAGVGLLLVSATTLQSQQANSYRDLLMALRDTVFAVQAAGLEFGGDLRGLEADSVLIRAANVRRQCEAAGTLVPEAISRIQPATRSGRARKQALSLVGALQGLNIALRNCEEGLSDTVSANRADSLRAWGLYRVKQTEQAIRAYGSAADRFAEALGIRIEPKAQPQ